MLDIDGVMVPAKGWKSPQLLSDGFPVFSSKATQVLQAIVSDDTTVMLTTSHKSRYTIDEWKSIFESRGIKIKNLGVLDNNTDNLSRLEEVTKWLSANKAVKDLVIIDDDKSLNDLPAALKGRLILTSPLIGLTHAHLPQIELLFDKKLKAT
ncbi:MAG TPA: HAD domain-containing protein [Chitinophagales bacterium]|nr:HAD domain-containing protein [Chitinophagales bacterium]